MIGLAFIIWIESPNQPTNHKQGGWCATIALTD